MDAGQQMTTMQALMAGLDAITLLVVVVWMRRTETNA
jgi:hypothetical protein